MVAFPPTQVIHKIMRGLNDDVGAAFALGEIQAAKGNDWQCLQARATDVGTNITVARVVNHVVVDRPDIADRQSLGIVFIRNVGRGSGKLRGAGGIGRNEFVILQIAANVRGLFGSYVRIELDDVGVQFRGNCCRERVANEVQAVSRSGAVWDEIAAQNGQHRWIYTGA